ncbi:hypothetical protein [Azospirillum sp. sgz302134]
MLYLVSLQAKGFINQMEEEHLQAFKDGVQKAMSKGSIVGAYSKVGGGLVLVVNSPGNAELTVELRKNFIMDAEVTPLVPLLDLLDAHVEHRRTGKVAV